MRMTIDLGLGVATRSRMHGGPEKHLLAAIVEGGDLKRRRNSCKYLISYCMVFVKYLKYRVSYIGLFCFVWGSFSFLLLLIDLTKMHRVPNKCQALS